MYLLLLATVFCIFAIWMFNNENRSIDTIVVVREVDANCMSAVSTGSIPGAPVLPVKLTDQNLGNPSVSDPKHLSMTS